MKPARRFPCQRTAASALVITLAIVTLLSVLLLGFLSGLRTETSATRIHVNGLRAGFYARMGADAAQARLAAAMPNVAKVNTMRLPTNGLTPASTPTPNVASLWATQPGRVLTTSTAADSPVLGVTTDLSSGVSTSATDDAVDLNPPTLADSTRRLLSQTNASLFPGGNPAMRVRWRYVCQDGTFRDTLPATPAAATSPVVGRFAFWTDDESARVNVNTGWTRAAASNNTNSLSHPSRVSLDALSLLSALPSEPDAIRNWRINQHPFNSLPEVQAVDATTAQLPKQSALNLTTANHSLDLNLLGERRIVLTTQQKLAGGAEFLDILATPNTDPGNYYNLSTAKIISLVQRLAALLMRTDWPVNPGAAFAVPHGATVANTKYTDDGWAYQTALNIMDYVRSRESTNPVVEPIRLDYITPAAGAGHVGANAASVSMVGNSRRPLITEIGVWYGTTGVTSDQGTVYKVEVYLPKNSGFPAPAQLNLVKPLGANDDNPAGSTSGLFLNIGSVNPDATTITATTALFVEAFQVPVLSGPPPAAPDGNAYLDSSSPYISEGGCRTITYKFPKTASTTIPWWDSRVLTPPAKRPTRLLLNASLETTLKAATASNLAVNVDDAPSSDDKSKMPIYLVDDKLVALASITSLTVVTDPRLNKDASNFKQLPNTFGAANDTSGSLTPVAGLSAPQDTDSSGVIVTDSVRLPEPKGMGANSTGVVSSVGELGFVHSGMQCRQGGGSGTPWRTLRLQPQTTASSATVLPDWAIMDLFAAPIVASATPANEAALLQPTFRSTAGKINLNARVYPFVDPGTGQPSMTRLEPLRTLLLGAKKTTDGTTLVSATDAADLANKIVARTKANGGANNLQGRDFGTGEAANTYFAPGQLAEIAGFADGGEASEELLRGVIELCTGRGGGVFTVFSIGQAIQQDAKGNVTVLGEQRCQRVVERWEQISASGTNDPGDDKITTTFRTVYSRDLTP